MRLVLAAFFSFAVSMALAGDGDWDPHALWAPANPKFTEKGSRDFESNGPMLRSIRVSMRPVGPAETCEKLFARMKAHPIGAPFALGAANRYEGWGDWKDDFDAVEGCDHFPCKIKFNEPESLAIAAKPKEGRLDETLRQIDGRVREYAKSFRRHGYDLPEDPVDPWAEFKSRGHEMPPTLEHGKPIFFARKLKFGEGNYRPLRQIFDERTFQSKGRFVRVSRDAYTAHYFDGWGEWLEARCSKDGKTLYLLQDLLMEFDLLKNTDLFSRIARPKMRQGVDQESLRLQKEQADRLFAP